MLAAKKKVYVDTIAEYHKLANIPKPDHPLLSVIRFEDLKWEPENRITSFVRNFYTVALKGNVNAKFKYGQHGIDFDEAAMHFMLPKQVLTIETPIEKITNSGWLLLIHPDFLLHSPLSKKIRQYEFFSYRFNQPLRLSSDQDKTVAQIFKNICQEHHNSVDEDNRNIILAQIELLLAYSQQFYKKQFFIEKVIDDHSILAQLELLVNQYLKNGELARKGIPSIQYIADELRVSPNYLSRLLQGLTGQTTKHFLRDQIIELAKEKLTTTELTVSELSYELGFKSPQSFSRLFKSNINQTPLEFRNSFAWEYKG